MNKREIILETTLDLLAELGLQNISIPLIIKRSGVASGTIYHYFKGKEHLIESLYLELKIEAGNAFTQGLNQEISFKDSFFFK